ncbi:hypothetical protein [Natronospira bacteriovora]|uniref:YggT family protein n=1 Tax=Natronospira bacteriovora TaxID=3069753 RepID=A0ABU0W8G5_9GAMM|nr:hypothetical protein [Natronospira sp. AB-CW4]MDQ2070325.1 hypothetical protein [Natronospira sp. AB-CW4]
MNLIFITILMGAFLSIRMARISMPTFQTPYLYTLEFFLLIKLFRDVIEPLLGLSTLSAGTPPHWDLVAVLALFLWLSSMRWMLQRARAEAT